MYSFFEINKRKKKSIVIFWRSLLGANKFWSNPKISQQKGLRNRSELANEDISTYENKNKNEIKRSWRSQESGRIWNDCNQCLRSVLWIMSLFSFFFPERMECVPIPRKEKENTCDLSASGGNEISSKQLLSFLFDWYPPRKKLVLESVNKSKEFIHRSFVKMLYFILAEEEYRLNIRITSRIRRTGCWWANYTLRSCNKFIYPPVTRQLNSFYKVFFFFFWGAQCDINNASKRTTFSDRFTQGLWKVLFSLVNIVFRGWVLQIQRQLLLSHCQDLDVDDTS